MNYWLLKTEGDVYPINQLEKDGKTPWSGVRNFRARNYMRDQMKIDDICLFYHSSCKEPGVYGLAKVASNPYADPTQFDKKSEYYDEKSSKENPRWTLVDIAFEEKFPKPITAAQMKKETELQNMMLWRIAQLSIQPISEAEFRHVLTMVE